MTTIPYRGHLLVIENHPDLREALRDVLSDEGYSVRVAADGHEGLQRLQELPQPSLVLLEPAIEGGSGLLFLTVVRADPLLAMVPVIVLTSASYLSLPDGVQCVLCKPVGLERLLAEIARHCPPDGAGPLLQ